MYQFTWDRRRHDENTGKEDSHKCLAKEQVATTPEGMRIGFCRTCNYIVFWR